jgi:hypothetical protein
MYEESKIPIKNKTLFDKKIIEIYDPVHFQRYWYANVKNTKEFNNLLMALIPKCSDIVDFTEVEEDADGECVDITINGHLIIILWSDLKSINTIAHECLHAVIMAAKSRGIKMIKNDDAICYMFGFLIDELFKKLNLDIKKCK